MSAVLAEEVCPRHAFVNPELPPIQRTILALLDGDQGPAVRELYNTLHRSIRSRVRHRAQTRYSDLLGTDDQDDLISEVECQLLFGALRSFRGTTTGELLAFSRTITDRQIWRTVQRRIRERRLLEDECAGNVIDWHSRPASPEQALIAIPQSPLAPADTEYILGLVEAGSQAAYARKRQVSRAAVTQRIHRIRNRIGHMSERDRDTAQCWLRQILTHTRHQR